MTREGDSLLLVAAAALLSALLALGLHAAFRPAPAGSLPTPTGLPSATASPSPLPSPRRPAPPPEAPAPSPTPAPEESSPSPSPAPSPRASESPPGPAPTAEPGEPPSAPPGPVEVPLEAPPREVPTDGAPGSKIPPEESPPGGPLQVGATMLPWNVDSPDPGVRVRVDLANPSGQVLYVDLAAATFLDDYGRPLVDDRQEVPPLEAGETREVWFYYVNAGRLPRARAVLSLHYRVGGEAWHLERVVP